MSIMNSKLTYKIFSIGAGMLIASATGIIARKAWTTFRNDAPPENPDNPETEWKDALIWSVATAVTAGITRMLIMRGANEGWKAVTGELPPPMQA